MSFKTDVRRSFFARLAVGLVADASDLSLYPGLERTADGGYAFDHDGTTYSLRAKLGGEAVEMPGVTVFFLGDVDTTPERLSRKRYVAPVAVVVSRQIEATDQALATESEVRDLADRVERILSEGLVEVWDFSASPPARTRWNANWLGSSFTWRDDSLVEEGGDIRLTVGIDLEYLDY